MSNVAYNLTEFVSFTVEQIPFTNLLALNFPSVFLLVLKAANKIRPLKINTKPFRYKAKCAFIYKNKA